MKKNVGQTDKIIRLLAALILVGLWYKNVLPGTVGIIAVVLAAVFVLTSLVGFCPLYALLGLNTCPAKK